MKNKSKANINWLPVQMSICMYVCLSLQPINMSFMTSLNARRPSVMLQLLLSMLPLITRHLQWVPFVRQLPFQPMSTSTSLSHFCLCFSFCALLQFLSHFSLFFLFFYFGGACCDFISFLLFGLCLMRSASFHFEQFS